MNIKFILVGVIVALPLISVAQNIPTLMNLPAKYAEGPDGDILEDSKKDKSTQMWTVFSDRDDNKAYDKPSLGAAISTVNFMDKFYVTDESGDFLEVYKWAEGIKIQNNEKKVQLNPNKAQRVGWIKKENLLLWNRCLKEKTTDFDERGFIVLTDKNFGTIASSSLKNPGTFFSSPDLQKVKNNTTLAFQILYVYKRMCKSVLIGKVHKSNIYNADKDILGWVDESILKLWNNRLFIEPNWDNDAISERKKTGIKASLFLGKTAAVQWKDGKETQHKSIWDKDPYEERWEGSRKRFPVFETDSGIVFTGFSTSLFNDSIDLIAAADQNRRITDIQNKFKETINNLKKINIVFVVDAGFGMGSYSTAITKSINDLIAKRDEMGYEGEKRNIYRYGAVVYRSEEDKLCPTGNLSINKAVLTANSTSISTFLKKEFENVGCSNNELNKNVNGALLEALNLIKDVNKESTSIQSNYICLIGGATGNKNAELQKIPTLIASYGVNLSVFQVYSNSFKEFPKFDSNFIQTFNIAGIRRSEIIGKIMKKTGIKHLNTSNVCTYELDYPFKNLIQGSITFPKTTGAISFDLLKNKIDSSLQHFENTVESDIRELENRSGPVYYKVILLNPLVAQYFQDKGIKISDSVLLNKFTGKNQQFFIPAWTTLSINNIQAPIFKIGIYISEEELFDMINKFEKLHFDESPTAIRKLMYTAYQSLAELYCGKDVNMSKKMKNMLSLDDIFSKITGLPSSTSFLKDIKLNDIRDNKKVTDEQIEEIRTKIRLSLEKLKSVAKDLNNTMRDASENGVYYWIPGDYFP